MAALSLGSGSRMVIPCQLMEGGGKLLLGICNGNGKESRKNGCKNLLKNLIQYV